MIRGGRFQVFRHVKRCHGVVLSFLTDTLKDGVYDLRDCHTDVQASDIFTKFFINPLKWKRAAELIGVMRETEYKAFNKVDRKSVRDFKGHLGACAAPCTRKMA